MNLFRIWRFQNLIFLIIFIIFFLIIIINVRDLYIDFLWYESQKQVNVFWINFSLKYNFYIIGFFISLIFYLLIYFISIYHLKKAFYLNTLNKKIKVLSITIAIFLSLFIHGNLFTRLFISYLQWFYSKNTGIVDPILKMDISFYVLKLPFIQEILNWFHSLFFFLIIYNLIVVLLFLTLEGFKRIFNNLALFKELMFLIFITLGFIIILFSLQLYLKVFTFVIEGSSNAVTGASYLDVNIKIPFYKIFSYLVFFLGISFIIGSIIKNWKFPALLLVIILLIHFFVIAIYSNIILYFKIKPNEFSLEEKFIQYDIQYTKLGYGLNQIRSKIFDVDKNLNYDIIKEHKDIIENIRIWDYRPIKDTLKQLQEIRLYYEFYDIDLDRYIINGSPRQVLISARELNSKELPIQAKQWIPYHLQYTHGYGIVMAPTNIVTTEGLPELWIKDFPPQSSVKDLPEIKRPEIYYGELTDDYVIVNTKFLEIDYPVETGFKNTSYNGQGGLIIGSGLRKLLIASKFDMWKILISKYILPESKILINRQIQEAVKKLAPFLILDPDPYIVIGKDGKLYWLMDAYTYSNNYPYSKKTNPYRILNNFYIRADFYRIEEWNYIRNSVKIVIDAYDGIIQLYQWDEDPIIETYKKIYPELIKEKKEFPEFLLPHIRYPEFLFFLQSILYTDYHMNDPKTFYTKEDRWEIPEEIVYGNQAIMEPYYAILPLEENSKKLETILMIPFIPKNKQNLIAWMAVRCDFHSKYGEIIVYEIPRSKQIYGPMQIESRIDQDADISKDLTLWNQQGSSVIRGNLLIIPIKNSFIYVEPIYLQASQSPFPELKRIIVATGNALSMGETFEDSLEKLFTKKIEIQSTNKEIKSQNKGYIILQKAKEQLQKGNWKKFGEYMQQLEELLKE